MGALGPVFSWSTTPPPYGLPAVPVPDAQVGALLAEAEGVVGSGLGMTWDGSTLSFVSRPGSRERAAASSPDDLQHALTAARDKGAAGVEVEVAGGDSTVALPFDDPSIAPRLATRPLDVAGGESLDVDLVLAGRGVVRAGRVAELQGFADRVGIGVLNTYTAKGVFKWDSPYHFGTGCLQERDLALAGVRAGARVLTVGVDADECAPDLLRAAGVDASSLVGIEVSELPTAQVRRAAAGTDLTPPPLYYAIFDIAQPLYKLTESPLNPGRAAADIAEVLPDGSAVCVEPGLPGLWVGRTLPTRYLGSARVPAAGRSGTAVAGALLGALSGAPRVAIVADALGEDDERLLDWARSAGLNVTVIVWTLDAPARNAEEHRAVLASALAKPGVNVLPVAVDLAATQLLIDAAGPLVAWS
jgi:hypothetical protein